MIKGSFMIVQENSLPKTANIMDAIFLQIKKSRTIDEQIKAKVVVQGYKHMEKNIIIHNPINLKLQGVRLIITIAAMFNFKIWT